MADEGIFRIMFALLVLALIVISVAYRYQAGQQGGQVSYKEGKAHMLVQVVLGVVGITAIGALIVAPRSMAWAALPVPASLRWGGVGLGVIALVLLVWVHHTLGRNFSSILHVRDDHQLITNGPYRWVWHPMYTAFYLVFASWFLVSANWFIAVFWSAGLTAVLLVRLRREEAVMIETFGEQYRRYMQHTGRFLPRRARLTTRGRHR